MKPLLSILMVSILFSCSSTKIKKHILATWETTYIKIVMPTHNNSDSTFTYKDNFSKKNSIKAQSTYYKNGTFEAWYINNGKKQNNTLGKWKVTNDSLWVNYTYKNKTIKAPYKITPTKKGFTAISIYDWDNDGKKDDTLFMKSKKILLK